MIKQKEISEDGFMNNLYLDQCNTHNSSLLVKVLRVMIICFLKLFLTRGRYDHEVPEKKSVHGQNLYLDQKPNHESPEKAGKNFYERFMDKTYTWINKLNSSLGTQAREQLELSENIKKG